MPSSCRAPGCKEGYGSKKSSLSFFSVPQNPEKRAKWQAALPRKDFVLRAGQVICEKHFAPQDIIRKRLFKDGDGNIIGVSPYRIPRVAENAVPTLFPDCPDYLSKKTPQSRQSSYKFMQGESLGYGEREMETGDLTDLKISSYDSPSLFEEPVAQSPKIEPFSSVYGNSIAVDLPSCWSKNIPLFGPKAVIFSQFICNFSKDGSITPVLYKQVCFNEDNSVTCTALGRSIQLQQLGINNDPLQGIDDLKLVLMKMNEVKLCKGNVDTGFKYIDTTVGRVDPMGHIRHIQCKLTVIDEDVCPSCRQLRRFLLQKNLRAKRDTGLTVLRRPKNGSLASHSSHG